MQTPTLSRPHAASRFHKAAAEAFELAADHHRRAAHHRDRGEHVQANTLSASARMHAHSGDEQARAAGEHWRN